MQALDGKTALQGSAKSPQAAALQLYDVINAQSSVVKSQAS